MTTRQAAYLTRRRLEWAAAGLCLDCGGEVVADPPPKKRGRPATGYRCSKCRAIRADQARKRRAKIASS